MAGWLKELWLKAKQEFLDVHHEEQRPEFHYIRTENDRVLIECRSAKELRLLGRIVEDFTEVAKDDFSDHSPVHYHIARVLAGALLSRAENQRQRSRKFSLMEFGYLAALIKAYGEFRYSAVGSSRSGKPPVSEQRFETISRPLLWFAGNNPSISGGDKPQL